MSIYICQICGDAYIGTEKPHDCPFCGAKQAFIKLGKEYTPLLELSGPLSELSKKNLEYSLELEKTAWGIYTCMAEYADSYEIEAMYKDLAKVEREHAYIIAKMLGQERPEIRQEICSEDDIENFQRTVELEDNAIRQYQQFAKQATEQPVRILFTALVQVEQGHSELVQGCMERRNI